MADPRQSVAAHGNLRRYVLANEQIVVATRRHWSKLLEPIATTVAVFLVVGSVLQYFSPEQRDVLQWLWLLWFVALGRLTLKWLEWYYEWFIATDKRLLLAYGLVIHRVAMMPLSKVTDMGYSRTPLGQVLGYGRFVLESAGQDQALRQIDWVPRPDDTYRKLCATIFRPIFGQPPIPQPGQSRPPALVPGSREPRPTTQPIPVVTTGSPDRMGPADPLERPEGRSRRGSWGRAGQRPDPGPDDFPRPPEGTGGGTTIPKPFL